MTVAKVLKYFHLGMVFVWAILAIPGIILWKDSVLFVIILSLYANIAGEFSGYQAARTETKQDDENDDSS